MSTITYKSDIVAWANEQAQLLRNKQFNLLDIEHLAEEIADVGKSKQRELANRMPESFLWTMDEILSNDWLPNNL
jgi:hypothetical protein